MAQKNTSSELSASFMPIFALSVLFFCFFYAGYLVYSKIHKNQYNQKISIYGEKLSLTNYYLYKNKIYLNLSGKFYQIEDADEDTFKIFQNKDNLTQFAYDEDNIYCGLTAIPRISKNIPQKLTDNYVKNGDSVIFCDSSTQENPSHKKHDLIDNFLPFLASTDPKYYYPVQVLPESKTPYLSTPFRNIISLGKQAFFQGQMMPKSDITQLYEIPSQSHDISNNTYYSDHEHVYYLSKMINIKDQGQLATENFGNSIYLHDLSNNNYFYQNYSLPVQSAPYRILNPNSLHSYHIIFLSQNGLFSFDQHLQHSIQLSKNIFDHQNLTEIEAEVYQDGQHIYFLVSDSIKSSSYKVLAEETGLYQLSNSDFRNWHKIKDIHDNDNIGNKLGSIWTDGHKNYFIDHLGKSLLIPSSLYFIRDQSTFNALSTSPLRAKDILHMKMDEKLLFPDSNAVAVARTSIK